MYAKVDIKLPDIKRPYSNYSNPATKRQNIAMVREINKKYSTQINNWGKIFDIPAGVLIAFIATESGGKMVGPNRYKATGLMQVTPDAIAECARKWQVEVPTPLPNEARNLLIQKVPTFFTFKYSNGQMPSSVERPILSNLQFDANYNIMCGTLILRWLIERFTDASGVSKSLNKAMVGYNAGAYRVVLGGTKLTRETPVDSTALASNRAVPFESRAYLEKMLGQDGFLELIYRYNALA
jgi:soluble lytic murein transglycosylase-like protein